MAKFCTECGAEMTEDMQYCIYCGKQSVYTNTADSTEKSPENTHAESVNYQQQNSYGQNQVKTSTVTLPPYTAQQPQAAQTINQYQQPPQYQTESKNNSSAVVSTPAFFGMILLFSIPIIGFIACIIMSFVPSNNNIKHFARASLIWTIMTFVILALCLFLLFSMINVLIEWMQTEIGPLLYDIVEDFVDINGAESYIEGFQNGEFDFNEYIDKFGNEEFDEYMNGIEGGDLCNSIGI